MNSNSQDTFNTGYVKVLKLIRIYEGVSERYIDSIDGFLYLLVTARSGFLIAK